MYHAYIKAMIFNQFALIDEYTCHGEMVMYCYDDHTRRVLVCFTLATQFKCASFNEVVRGYRLNIISVFN